MPLSSPKYALSLAVMEYSTNRTEIPGSQLFIKIRHSVKSYCVFGIAVHRGNIRYWTTNRIIYIGSLWQRTCNKTILSVHFETQNTDDSVQESTMEAGNAYLLHGAIYRWVSHILSAAHIQQTLL